MEAKAMEADMTWSHDTPQSMRRLAAMLACVVAMSSMPAGAEGPVVQPSQPVDPGGGFVDVTGAIGLLYPVSHDEQEKEIGAGRLEDGGLALADIDGDGRLDLHVSHGRSETGRLFSWDGRRFAARAGNGGIAPAAMDRAGYFIDLDEDGAPDFLSIHQSGVQALRNDGRGQFTPMPASFATSSAEGFDGHYSIAAGDYDSDGDLDLIFTRWGRIASGFKIPFQRLWRNDGRGRFEDVSHVVPIRTARTESTDAPAEFSFTPTFSDIDGDGDPDLLLAGDFGTSQVLRNDGGRGFTDIRDAVISDENGMGAAVGDYDHDGDMDWFVTSIHDPGGGSGFGPTGNRLYRNRGDGRFEDATDRTGVRAGGWGWGACLADFDNDGHPDIFHTNGYGELVGHGELAGRLVGRTADADRDYTPFLDDPSRLFMADGDGTFTERASRLGVRHTGQGRGVVCTDYDQDGRVDIFIANNGAAPTVYRNVFDNGHHWLAIDLAGRHSNPLAIGARVTVHTASGRQVQEVRLGTAYLSQAPTVLHFGLGADRMARSIEVRWPGPESRVTRIENVPADRRLTIRQPEDGRHLLSVVGGTGTGLHAGGAQVAIEAEVVHDSHGFYRWAGEGGVVFADAHAPRTTVVVPHGPARVFARYLPGPPLADADISVPRRWIEVLLQAIRNDTARPTVHARNLFHVAAAMYDAWAAYSRTARPWLFGEARELCARPAPPAAGDIRRAREEAISHAAWRLVRHRFRHSPGVTRTARNADMLMAALGYAGASATSPAAELGRCLAELYITRGLEDGSNEENGYASLSYAHVNTEMPPSVPGNPELTDPDRWQPLDLQLYVDQSGHVLDGVAEFITPEWGRVTPFALSEEDLTVYRRDGGDYHVYHDPGPPPTLRGPLSEHYKWGFALVAMWSSHLSPEDGVRIDIAPSGQGNLAALPRRIDEYPDFYDPVPQGPGHRINPATGRPYTPQWVPRGDYTRVLAEYWADGPDSETPPGHWFTILNAVNDHERLARRLGGRGPRLGPLEWDVKAYFALGGAMHDAAVAAWGIKGWYDYVRPISALRTMADRGQSGDPDGPAWSPEGMPLAERLIELIGPDDRLAGENGEHVGKVKVLAWRGPGHIDSPVTDTAGVGWIRAENWWPYQRPTFVTPPFAGYVSGHSTFSRAAAEVLTALTGDPFFPGGMSAFPIPANTFLAFERGPSVDMVLQWATYRDAADQCSLSRIWGGIHPPVDDIPGRLIGERIGRDAFRLAMFLFEGGRRESPR